MAIDIKGSLVSFGTITGQVTNDELLGSNIFVISASGSKISWFSKPASP
jgi:hypothetical protein